jgi:hypothetical protein
MTQIPVTPVFSLPLRSGERQQANACPRRCITSRDDCSCLEGPPLRGPWTTRRSSLQPCAIDNNTVVGCCNTTATTATPPLPSNAAEVGPLLRSGLGSGEIRVGWRSLVPEIQAGSESQPHLLGRLLRFALRLCRSPAASFPQQSASRTLSCLAAVLGLFFAPALVAADDGVCARVVLQIDQELTLEREGFEARLGISNGLPSALDDFHVTLRFTDRDGNAVRVATDATPDPDAKFYYRVQTGFAVPGSVAAGATSKVTYFIVPAPGAAGASAEGTLYYVGATVRYKVGSVEEIVQIAPDFIYVRPMPQLRLQYFLPGEVYSDDPLTTPEEPAVPFTLGVRVVNHSSFATARRVRIQSGQPEIVDNQLGLLVAFRLLSCQVNDQPVQPSLLVDFGDIAPQRASVASWQMTSSLSGRFTRFSAEISHAPEFGGALTSLIPEDAVSTHRLIGRVRVDLPGRDTVLDFLGSDAMAGDIAEPKVYESDHDQIAQPVDYFAPGNSAVTLTPAGATATLAVNAASTLLYLRASSPFNADKIVTAVRSDGKALPASNCWVSKSQQSGGQWTYWLNLFDTAKEAGHTYILAFSDPPPPNQPPVLTIIGGRTFQISAARAFTLGVSATDPDGAVPVLSVGALPDGATFTDHGDGRGAFQWIPRLDQLGTYTVQFRASDGVATDAKSASIQVLAYVAPTFRNWQQLRWPATTDPTIIGPTADPDGDRLNNLLEYALDSDPTVADDSVLPEIGVMTVAGQRYLTLMYRKRTDDPALVYEVVASDDIHAPIATWAVQTQTESVSQENLPAGIARVKVRDSVPIETGPTQRYLRLRVTHTETP